MYTVFSIKETVNLNNKYLFSLLKSTHFIQEFSEGAYGSVRQQLRFADLADMHIPYPEQGKINEMINKIKKQEAIQAELSSIQKSISDSIDDLFSED
jgi:restriction endonuclease S subunit